MRVGMHWPISGVSEITSKWVSKKKLLGGREHVFYNAAPYVVL